MKIAVNTRFLLQSGLEGVGRYTYEITKRMVKNHPEIEFHFLFDRGYDERFIFGSNVIPHVVYPSARHPILWKLWYDYGVPRVLKKIGADCFFSPDNYCSLRTDVPTIMVTHDLSFEHYPEFIRGSHLRYFRQNSERFHHRADKIACVSQFTRLDVIKRYDIPEDKTFVTYNSCDDSHVPKGEIEKQSVRNKITSGAEYFITIGAIHPRKNINRLIQAFDQYKSKSESATKLVIVGRWAWKYDKTRDLIRNSRYANEIIHFENVNQLNELVAAAKTLVYISLFEGFGIPILEAFACKVPVITSNVSSMPEVAGDAALLINPKDIKDIAGALEKMDTNNDFRNQLIEKGNVRGRNFNWDDSANSIMREIKKLV